MTCNQAFFALKVDLERFSDPKHNVKMLGVDWNDIYALHIWAESKYRGKMICNIMIHDIYTTYSYVIKTDFVRVWCQNARRHAWTISLNGIGRTARTYPSTMWRFEQVSFNQDHNITGLVSSHECKDSIHKIRIWCSKWEPLRLLSPLFRHGVPPYRYIIFHLTMPVKSNSTTVKHGCNEYARFI